MAELRVKDRICDVCQERQAECRSKEAEGRVLCRRCYFQAWKARNRDRYRAASRSWKARNPGTCSGCGEEMSREHDGGVCRRCRRRRRDESRRAIELAWADGLTQREIAELLATSENRVRVEMGRMRRDNPGSLPRRPSGGLKAGRA
jgi:hypothetical protein